MLQRLIFLTLLLWVCMSASGCFTVPMVEDYEGPPARPAYFEEYYGKAEGYGAFTIETVREERDFTVKKIVVQSAAGDITMDYYQQDLPSDDLVFVFPVLGGRKNMIAGYFADYFARKGYDTAVVHRDKDFKKPEMVDRLEEIFQNNVIRDRLAIDFFEEEFGKRHFGSFGISRGAINVAMSAGVDERLRYNVMALGGTSLVKLFANSDERRIKKYKETVKSDKNLLSDEAFTDYLEGYLRSTPDYLAQYMDGRNAYMILSLFDDTVPITYGRELRDQLGKPTTTFLLADHKTSILYTGFVPLFPPSRCFSIFPIDYIENEALYFFDTSFKRPRVNPKHLFFEMLQVPFYVTEGIIRAFF